MSPTKETNQGEQSPPKLRFDPFGRDDDTILQAAPFFEWLLGSYFSLKVTGVENIPKEGRAILVANHAGALPWDALVLLAGLQQLPEHKRSIRPLLEDAVMTAPFLGQWMARLGCVRASQDNASHLLQDEQMVTVFPEGMLGLSKTYRKKYQLVRFGRAGFVRLAIRTKAPLVPVTILGAEDSAPLLTKVNMLFQNTAATYLPITPTFPLLGPFGLLPLPAKWHIHFGEPLRPHAKKITLSDDLAINDVADSIRKGIQEKLDTLVDQRPHRYNFLKGL